MLLTKVVMDGTPRWVELDIKVKEDGYQQQTHKGVLLEVEPSSQSRSEPKESIKSAPSFGWMDKGDSTTFWSALGSMKRESWMGALMKRKALVHKSKSKVGGDVGIYRTRVGMRFAYQGLSRIQGSKKTRSKELDIEDLLSTQEVKIAEVLAHHDVGGGRGTEGEEVARRQQHSRRPVGFGRCSKLASLSSARVLVRVKRVQDFNQSSSYILVNFSVGLPT
ncbi:unnamed protein product [Prunus brigantina]